MPDVKLEIVLDDSTQAQLRRLCNAMNAGISGDDPKLGPAAVFRLLGQMQLRSVLKRLDGLLPITDTEARDLARELHRQRQPRVDYGYGLERTR